MKISVNEHSAIEVEELFNPMTFVSTNGEELHLTMRDGGFEITYGEKHYSLNEGFITQLIERGCPEESDPTTPI